MQATLERLHQRREERGDEGGFTLIELLIVIVILGILAAIVVFAVQNLASSSSKASCGSDEKTVETAVEAYKAQVGVYPGGALPTGVTVGTAGTAATGLYPAAAATGINDLMTSYNVTGGQTVGPWLKDVPANPTHYGIAVITTGATGALEVFNGTGTTATTVAACANITN